jgi:hypothetical protein
VSRLLLPCGRRMAILASSGKLFLVAVHELIAMWRLPSPS